VISPQKLIEARKWVSKNYMDDKIKRYIVNLVHATRRPSEYGLSELASLISVGASPRASIDLSKAAKANAFIEGRAFVTPEDIKAVGKSVLRHRIGLTYEAEAEEVSQDDVVKKLFDGVEVP
jgi:MoxR-like ATPase